MATSPQSAADHHAERLARLTPAQREAVEQEHDERMAARLNELLVGDPAEHFTMHKVSKVNRNS